ncbi:TPA: hypothetical protein NEF91_003640 [Klebsiella oxytoca]|uniref:hypothetical protein n=1 Tax=Klebsiella grimontii TaxID=2058152 RepID=UPI00292D7E13|nr:hypothetical protein [Klebsiella grimontii]HCD9026231.1 hypothetical protein [Klebsiella oxytoca]
MSYIVKNKPEVVNNSKPLTVAEIFNSGVTTGKISMHVLLGAHLSILKAKIQRDKLTPLEVLEDLERWAEGKIGGIDEPIQR